MRYRALRARDRGEPSSAESAVVMWAVGCGCRLERVLQAKRDEGVVVVVVVGCTRGFVLCVQGAGFYCTILLLLLSPADPRYGAAFYASPTQHSPG